jgi:hypothetical protein
MEQKVTVDPVFTHLKVLSGFPQKIMGLPAGNYSLAGRIKKI